MAWKYLGLSPYNYCGNDGVNRIDMFGCDWYKQSGDDRYIYYDHKLQESEENSIVHMGLCFSDNGQYYSLFGEILPLNGSKGAIGIGQLYRIIDKAIITHITNPTDEEGNVRKTNLYITGVSPGTYHFCYKGIHFFSEMWGDKRKKKDDGTVFRASDKDNSSLYIIDFAERYHRLSGYLGGNDFWGYWIQTGNNKGINEGHRIIQIKFDRHNAEEFLKSCN